MQQLFKLQVKIFVSIVSFENITASSNYSHFTKPLTLIKCIKTELNQTIS